MFEECDDANMLSGDGCGTQCAALCFTEPAKVVINKGSKNWIQAHPSANYKLHNCCCCSSLLVLSTCTRGVAPLAVLKLASFAKMGRRWFGTIAIQNAARTAKRWITPWSLLKTSNCSPKIWWFDHWCISFYFNVCMTKLPSSKVPAGGDGVRVPSEGCDDGNTFSGDGCSSTCNIETGDPMALRGRGNALGCNFFGQNEARWTVWLYFARLESCHKFQHNTKEAC